MASEPSSHQTPPVIEHAADLLARYEVLVCDVWGVMHDGRRAYERTGDALARFRTQGGTVVLLSNSPGPSSALVRLLAARGVRRDSWDTAVTSGDMTRVHLLEKGYRHIHHIGPPRDLHLFETLPIERVALADAEAIVCTGLNDDRTETGESYRQRLAEALSRHLALVCANPDLVVDVAGELLPCAGAIAAVYESMGGPVYWAGKPYAPAYAAALAAAEGITQTSIPRERVLAIGDAVRTDIAGAAAFGFDALFVAQGIHRADLMVDGRIDPERLAALFAPPAPRAVAAMAELQW